MSVSGVDSRMCLAQGGHGSVTQDVGSSLDLLGTLAARVLVGGWWRWRSAAPMARGVPRPDRAEQASLIFEAAPIGMALVSTDGRFVRVNPALCALLGYEAEELMLVTFQVITHPDDLDLDLEQMARCIDGSIDEYSLEKRYLHRAGHAVWVQLHVAVSRDAAGAAVQFVSQILDISARRAAEESLAASVSRFEALVEHGSDLISLSDRRGQLIYASPAYLTVLGFDPTDQLGRQLHDQIHPDDRERVVEVGSKLLETPGRDRDAGLPLRPRRRIVALGGGHADQPARRPRGAGHRDQHAGRDRSRPRDPAARPRGEPLRVDGAPQPDGPGLAPRGGDRSAHDRGDVMAGLYVDLDNFKDVNDTTGTRQGTCCSPRSRTGCGVPLGARTPWPGWAATSSWSSPPSTTTSSPPSWRPASAPPLTHPSDWAG